MSVLQEIYRVLEEKGFKEKLFLVWLICILATHNVIQGVQVPAFLICIVGIFNIKITRYYLYWLILGYVLSLNQIENYFHSANHYWLLIYTTFGIGLFKYLKSIDKYNFNVFRYLLIVVFGFATFYKIKSSFFRSGRLFTDYILDGAVLPYSLSFLFGEEFHTSIDAFATNNAILANQFPVNGQNIDLILPDPSFVLLIQGLTISVIIVELLIFIAFITPKIFYSKHFPFVIVLFVWSTFLMRNEYGFFSLLCLLSLFARPNMFRPYKVAMVATIAIFLAFEISDLGIYF